MAALHSALSTLGPTPYDAVPTSSPEIQSYLRDTFSKARLVVDSIPPPPLNPNTPTDRPRSNTTTSVASNASEISVSSARSDLLDPSNMAFQKEWGNPIKLSAKDNPLGMAVYKLPGKDKKGAWFARRSVHEGLGFTKWKLGLQREFPESLAVQGGPGEGNVRGIGGERRVERKEVDGVGIVEVYHLSAQFPGPTTPRDFVTLLITSSSALGESSSQETSTLSQHLSSSPRHFMIISKPCIHPDCPPRDGFIRGQYESVEFIREIPVKPRKSSSTTDLKLMGHQRANSTSLDRKARLRSAEQASRNAHLEALHPEERPSSNDLSPGLGRSESRRRGRTISYAESRGGHAKGEAMDLAAAAMQDIHERNPVEWVMITRSDPGGNVPRFLVERGTPGSIVADASKFLDWACQKEHPELDVRPREGSHVVGAEYTPVAEKENQELEAYQTNGHLAGLDGSADAIAPRPSPAEKPNSQGVSTIEAPRTAEEAGLMSSLANLAYAGLESYGPRIVIDHLPRSRSRQPSVSAPDEAGPATQVDSNGIKDVDDQASVASTSSVGSFASADSHLDGDDNSSAKSVTSLATAATKDGPAQSHHEKELLKLQERKKALDDKMAKTREKEMKDKETLTSREQDRLRKAEEKHAREMQKQEEKYKKEVARLEAKRTKEAAKVEERKRKADEKDERTRLLRELEALKQDLDVANREREILKDQVGMLQKENTALVVKMGKVDAGSNILKEVKSELALGARSRSDSFRRAKASSSGSGSGLSGVEATVLGVVKKGESATTP